MNIGQIAKLSGVSKDTVRLYTTKGITKSTAKQVGSREYAEYKPDVVKQIQVIKQIQALGFTLAEIKFLLDEIQDDCTLTSKQLSLLDTKLHEITVKQQQLKELSAFIKRKIREHS
jgi:DNA-binding transcriptional MerR regulator